MFLKPIINLKPIKMKKIIKLIFILTILCASACTEVKIENYEIYSIHEIEVLPWTDIEEFETFVMSEIAPLYNQMKGQHFFLTKGYVGQRTDKYAIFIAFDSQEDRDRIYPMEEGFSQEFKEIMKGKETMWDKFGSMATGFDGSSNTDYIKIIP